jgi:hypothetical protein
MHNDTTPKHFILWITRVVILICLWIFFFIDTNPDTYSNDNTHIVNNKTNTTILPQTTISLSAPIAINRKEDLNEPQHYWWGTFISSDWYFITASHVIESLDEWSSVHYWWKEFFNDTIHTHPEHDIALIKLFDVTTPCVLLTQELNPESWASLSWFIESSIDQENISFTHETEIVPWMSWSPIYWEEWTLSWIITQRDNTNEKKWQGVYLTPSLIKRIESHLGESYNTSCTIRDAAAQIQYKS